MADSGFFKGTSADQDRRFSDKEKKLLQSMKFPPEFDKKVDLRKVNLTLIKPWIAKKVTELVGFEDDIVIDYAMGLLENPDDKGLDPRRMQINLTGFMTNDTPAFMSALWKLLLEAQEDVTGIPRTFVEEKKEELRRARENDTRVFDERDRRARLDEVRDDGWGSRGRGRGGGRGGRGGRGGLGYGDSDRPPRDGDSGGGGRGYGRGPPPRRYSRSPPPRRRSRSGERDRSPPSRRYRSPPPGRRHSIDERSSDSPPPPPPSGSRRRPRSPSMTPPLRGGDGRDRRDRPNRPRDSRSPPPRRRRYFSSRSPSPPPPPARSPRSPRYSGGGGGKRDRERERDRERDRDRERERRSLTPPSSRGYPSPPPPPRSGRDGGGRPRRSFSGSPMRSVSRERERDRERERRPPPRHSREYTPSAGGSDSGAENGNGGGGGGLKIKGQAEVLNRRRSKWDEDEQAALEKRESELKEKALRNKVVKTRREATG